MSSTKHKNISSADGDDGKKPKNKWYQSEKLKKAAIPLTILVILFLIPVPTGMQPQSWHFFALFVAMIVGMIVEPLPATAISFISLVIAITFGNHLLLFSPAEMAQEGFSTVEASLKWGLASFSSGTVWIIFAAFMFALGYEITGLGRRIALLIVKLLGKNTLALGYGIVIIDVLLGPFTPSNTARTGGTVFPVIKNLPPLFDSHPNEKSARDIGSYLMWMMIIGTSISSMLFLTAAAPNILAVDLIHKSFPEVAITWSNWFLAALPVGIILLIISPYLSYILYKPRITHSKEVSIWAGTELKGMGKLTHKEIILLVLVVLSVIGWIAGEAYLNPTTVALIALSLMLIFGVLKWTDVVKYDQAWGTLVNLATLVAMASGLKKSGFIDWFAEFISHHLGGLNPFIATIALILLFYFSHYLFASLTAHVTTMLPVLLAIASAFPGLNILILCYLMVLSLGIMCVLTPYATGPAIIVYASGYIKSSDYWRLGAIFGVIFITILLCVGWPIISIFN